jgi:hypothetical protein
MSEYTDFWKSLDLPADQSPKNKDYSLVAENADKLALTDAEQYSLGWGPDALPEDWVKQRAKEINDQIQAAESTAILRRGLNTKGKTQEEIYAEAAAKALEEAKAKEAVNTPGAPRVDNSGGGDGQGPSDNTNSPGFSSHAPNDQDNALGTTATGISNATANAIGNAISAVTGIPGLGLVGVGLNSYASSQPGVTADNMAAVMGQMDAQAAENEANNPGGPAGGGASAGMGGATEGSAGSTAATSASPDGPDGNNGGGGDGGGGGGGGNADGGTGDTGSDGNGGGGTGDGDN